ncbi:hypothetical protein [Microcoleus sp. bin38.metabat.b11b12b14.051]|uniref:hypothetical protein n=1 Tax=Microcoleus sp. bin38.metabat.b11b12b14.051 TaxID=2742709 RepID=UPI0025D24BEB|nr:hypothetical protein [Microcoleus sp. bin38.metabat.b11b12b14.051]
MSDKTWNTQEILDFCPENLTDNVAVYVASVRSKIARILFIVDSFNVTEDLTLKLISDQFIKTQLKVEIYIESIASNLHSLADVLAQIINEIVLKPLLPCAEHISSEKVDINKVNTKLDGLTLDSVKDRYISQIIESINNLSSSSEFLYISSFVNTIKHRRLLDTTFHLKVDSGSLIDVGFKLDKFDYKGSHFPEMSCRSIVIDYREKLIDFIFDIGNSVNNYCRANYIQTV